MKSSVIINGMASGKCQKFKISASDYKKNVLEFLVSKEVPIASSCFGLGQCKKCVMNSDKLLACQITVKNLLNKHDGICSIDYL